MCIITDGHKVVSVSLIPGVDLRLPKGFVIYFPWVGELPKVGDVFDHLEYKFRDVVGEP